MTPHPSPASAALGREAAIYAAARDALPPRSPGRKVLEQLAKDAKTRQLREEMRRA